MRAFVAIILSRAGILGRILAVQVVDGGRTAQ